MESVDLTSNNHILPALRFSQEDINEFSDYILKCTQKSSNFNFTKIFIQFRARSCITEKIQVDNIYHKVLYLESFLNEDKFSGEIYSLSSNRTRGKLSEKFKNTSELEVIKIEEMVWACQKRSKFILESEIYRKSKKREALVKQEDYKKQLEAALRLMKSINELFPKIIEFKITSACQQTIYDYRVLFLADQLKLIYSYVTILSAYCYKMESLEQYQILEIFKNVVKINREMEEKRYVQLSKKGLKKIKIMEIYTGLMQALEEVYYCSNEKSIFDGVGQKGNDELLQVEFEKREQKQTKKLISLQSVLDFGLRVMKEYNLLSDRVHFTNLENFILDSYKTMKAEKIIQLNQANQMSKTTQDSIESNNPKLNTSTSITKKKPTVDPVKLNRRSHSSVLKALKKKEQEICVLNKSTNIEDLSDMDKPLLQKNKASKLGPKSIDSDDFKIDENELISILASEMTEEDLSESGNFLSVIQETNEDVSRCPSKY